MKEQMQNSDNATIMRKPRLVIRVGRHSLSFSALNQAEPGMIVYEPYTVKSGISMAANLREAFKQIDLQHGGWQRAVVLLDSDVLMVPVSEFNEQTAATLYCHAMTGKAAEQVLWTVLPALNAVAVYSVNKDLKLVVDDNFTEAKFHPLCAPVWNHLFKRSFTGVRQKLYCYFHDKRMEIFSYQQNRFKFTNSFDTDLVPDVVYFVLNVWKQLSFDAKRDELHLVGTIPERENLLQELRTFIRNVYVINPKAEFNRAPITAIEGLPYDLLTYFIKA